MKQIILGDIHGRTVWENILAKEDDFDRVIFLGDYVDTHHDISIEQQRVNLERIIELKKLYPDKIVLIIGNHDYHYWPGIEEKYSGFQSLGRTLFTQLYEENKHLFQIAFADEKSRIFTHAGITQSFLNRTAIHELTAKSIVKNLNDMFVYKPLLFGFYPGDRSDYGDDVRQSCIWVRPSALYYDRIDKLQFVGHTSVKQIKHPPAEDTRMKFYLVDALEQKQYIRTLDNTVFIEQL